MTGSNQQKIPNIGRLRGRLEYIPNEGIRRDALADLDGLVEQYEDIAIRADERSKMIEEYRETLSQRALQMDELIDERDSLKEQLEAAQLERNGLVAAARYALRHLEAGSPYDRVVVAKELRAALPGEAGALPPSPVASEVDASPVVSSPELSRARYALKELVMLGPGERVECVVEDPSILDYITVLLWPADLGPVSSPASEPEAE